MLDPLGINPILLNGSEDVSVNVEFLEENIVLFPNPNSSGILQIKGFVQGLRYDIYNVLGQTMKFGILESDKINLHNLSNNLYFIKLTEIESNKSVVKKIILSK